MANEYLRPSTSSGVWTNSASAYDGTDTGDNTTYASATTGNAVDTWSGFPSAGQTYTALTLHVVHEFSGSFLDDTYVLEYSLDGGSTWETPIQSGVPSGTTKTDFSVALSASQDLTLIQVRGSVLKTGGPDAGGEARVWEIYTDGVYTAGSIVTGAATASASATAASTGSKTLTGVISAAANATKTAAAAVILAGAVSLAAASTAAATSYQPIQYLVEYDWSQIDYLLDASDQNYVDNQGTSGATNDLDLYAGRGLALTGSATVDIPVIYTLSADKLSSITSPAAPVVVSGSNISCDGTGTDSWDSAQLDLNTTATTWSHRFMAYIELNITINSGTFTITGYDAGFSLTQLDTPITLTAGDNTVKIYGVAADTLVGLLVNGAVAFDIDINSITVKEFSTQNSYVTVFDPSTGLLTQENMHLGDQILSNNDFTGGLTDWAVQTPATYEVGTFYGRTDVLKVTTTDVVSGNRVTHNVSWLKGPYEVDTEAYIESGSLKIDGSDGYWVGEGALAYDPISVTSPTGQWTRFTEVGVALVDVAHQIWVRSQTGTSAVSYLDWIALRQIKQPVFTKQFSLATIGMVLVHTNPLSDADIAAIEAAPYKLAMLAKGVAGHGLSLTLETNDKFFAFMEPSGATVYNSRNASETATIANYAATIRTDADNLRKGLQSRYLTLDASGVITAVTFDKSIFHGISGDNTKWNPSLESAFIIEEVVDTTHYSHVYNGTTLTTWTNGVEGTPASHSPENAAYELGKGAYPKISTDSYSAYSQEFFRVVTGTNIAQYDPATAYNTWVGVTIVYGASSPAASSTVTAAAAAVFDGTAAPSGSATSSTTGSLVKIGAASPVASASASVTGEVILSGSASPSSSSSATASGSMQIQSTASPAASSTASSTASADRSSAAAPSSDAAAAASGSVVTDSVSAPSAQSTATASGLVDRGGSASPASSSTASASAVRTLGGSASPLSDASVTAIPSTIGQVDGIASAAADSSVTATADSIKAGSASMLSDAAASSVGSAERSSTATAAAASSVTATGVLDLGGVATPASDAGAAASAQVFGIVTGSASVLADASVSASGTLLGSVDGSAALNSIATINAVSGVERACSAAISSDASSSPVGSLDLLGSAAASSDAAASASGDIITVVQGSANASSSAGMTASGSVEISSSASPASDSSVDGSANADYSGSSTVEGLSTVGVSGDVAGPLTVEVSASAGVSAYGSTGEPEQDIRVVDFYTRVTDLPDTVVVLFDTPIVVDFEVIIQITDGTRVSDRG